MGVVGGILPWKALSRATGRVGRGEALVTLRRTSGKPRLESVEEFADFGGVRPSGMWGRPRAIGILCGAPLFLKIVNLPPLSRREALPAARYAVGDSLPFSPHEAAFDAWRMGNQTLAACAPHKALTRLQESSGARVFTTVPAALSALRSPGAARGGELFLLADDTVTGVYLLERGLPVFIRESPSGEDTPFIGESARALEYLRARRMTGPDTVVWVVGARAHDPDTLHALETSLSVRPRLFNPLEETVEASAALAARVKGREAAFALLIGAALDGGTRTRLATPRGAYVPWLATRPAVSGAAAAMALLALAWAGLQAARWDVDRQITAMTARPEPVEAAEMRAGELRVRIARERADIARLERELGNMPPLHGGGVDWEAMWFELARVMPPGAALTSVSVQVDDNGARTSLRGATRGQGSGEIAELRRLVEGLSASPAFSAVSVGGAAPAGPARGRLSFEIRARINEGALNVAMPGHRGGAAGS